MLFQVIDFSIKKARRVLVT